MTPSTVFQVIGAAVCYGALAFVTVWSCIRLGRWAERKGREHARAAEERRKREESERRYCIAFRTAQCRRRIQFDTVSPATLDELLSLIGSRVVEAES